jgi:hypothetical protein
MTVSAGLRVKRGEILLTIEAMKMKAARCVPSVMPPLPRWSRAREIASMQRIYSWPCGDSAISGLVETSNRFGESARQSNFAARQVAPSDFSSLLWFSE